MFRALLKKIKKKRVKTHWESNRDTEFSANRKVVRKRMVYRSYTMGRRLGYH